ncbi:hypothetical protein IFR05_005175 [Cadophora sp. M221]|nr:hypothetical protein IFR05_005175 [Cadophora sp. M221]
MSYNVGGPGSHYHDAPERIPYDNGHNAPETVQYVGAYPPNEKPLDAANPKIMEVGIGPRRRLGDMSASKFWIILGVICALVIAATVGGAVGGSLAARKDHDSSGASSPTSSATAVGASSTTLGSSSTAQTSTTSTSTSSATPSPTTFPAPSKDCQNGTTYNSLFQTGENGSVPPGAGLTFTRLCGQNADINNIGSAFVYSLDDCIEICAGINFWPGNRRCTSVIYRPEGKGKPVNCWAANETSLTGERSDLFMGLLQ